MAGNVNMVDNSSTQYNPIRKDIDFFDKQNQYKCENNVDYCRFVRGVLDTCYESVQIITNDTCKIAEILQDFVEDMI